MDTRKNIVLILLISMVSLSSFSVYAQSKEQGFKQQVKDLGNKLKQVQLENESLKKAVEISEQEVLVEREEAKTQSQMAQYAQAEAMKARQEALAQQVLAQKNAEEARLSQMEAEKQAEIANEQSMLAQQKAEEARIAAKEATKQAKAAMVAEARAQALAEEAVKQHELYMKCKEGK